MKDMVDNADRVPVAVKLLVAMVVLLPMLGATKMALVEPVIFRLSALMALIPFLLAWVVWKNSRLDFRGGLLIYALGIAVALAILTSSWAYSQYQAWLGVMRWLMVAALAVLVFNLCCDNKRAIKLILMAAALGGGYMALVGVGQYLWGWDFYSTPTLEYAWPSATSGHKNQAAQFVVMTLPLAIGMALLDKKPAAVWGWSLLAGLMLAFLVFARARQAWLAVLVECVLLLLVIRYGNLSGGVKGKNTVDRRKPAIGAALMFVVLVAMPPVHSDFSLENSALNRMLQRNTVYYQEGAKDGAISSRLNSWAVTLDMLPGFIEGAGLQNWASHYPKYNAQSENNYVYRGKTYAADVHNDYLQLLFELGLAVILPIGMIVYGLFAVGKRVIVTKSDESVAVFWTVLASLLGLSVVMFFSFPMSRMLQPAYLGALLGICAALGAKQGEIKVEARSLKSNWIVASLIVVGLCTSWVGYKMSLGNHSLWMAGVAHRKIETKLASGEQYSELMPERRAMATYLAKSMVNDPYNSRLAADRAGLYLYLSMTEQNPSHKKFYIDIAEKQFKLAYKYRPYAGFIHSLHAKLKGLEGDQQGQEKQLLLAAKYEPGSGKFVGALLKKYIEDGRLDEAFSVADHFLLRFFDRDVLAMYTYLAQETGQQARGLKVLGSIDLERKGNSYSDDMLFAYRKEIETFKKALSDQLARGGKY